MNVEFVSIFLRNEDLIFVIRFVESYFVKLDWCHINSYFGHVIDVGLESTYFSTTRNIRINVA